MICLIIYPAQSAAAAAKAVRVCAFSVVPSLFPFFVLAKLLLSGGLSFPFPDRFAEKCFGVSGPCLSAFFVSLLGGYPAGVAAVSDLYRNGAITKQDAERALCFCNNSGPAFFLSLIGATVLGSVKAGLTLYFIHIMSAVLCGRFFAARKSAGFQMRQIGPSGKPSEKRLPEAISESCAAVLQISGLIVFFSVLIAIAEEIGVFRLLEMFPRFPVKEAKALLCGVFELSCGILRSAESRFAFVLCAFLMGWGGFCVHLQAKAIWQASGLRPRRYYFSKLLHGLLSAIFALTLASPSALSVSVSSFVSLLCLFFPTISEKWGRNLAQNTL